MTPNQAAMPTTRHRTYPTRPTTEMTSGNQLEPKQLPGEDAPTQTEERQRYHGKAHQPRLHERVAEGLIPGVQGSTGLDELAAERDQHQSRHDAEHHDGPLDDPHRQVPDRRIFIELSQQGIHEHGDEHDADVVDRPEQRPQSDGGRVGRYPCQIVWRLQNRIQKERRGDTGGGGQQKEGCHHDLGPALLRTDDAFLCHFESSVNRLADFSLKPARTEFVLLSLGAWKARRTTQRERLRLVL